jgi:hypothetical protein
MSPELRSTTARLEDGTLQRAPQDPAVRAELEDLAATLPELFGTLELGCLNRIAQRLGTTSHGEELLELLLLSDSRVQVVHPLTRDPGLALVAISSAVGNIGLVLSRVHAELARLEAEE